MNNLIEWCEDLDYDKYISNWGMLATSSKHEGEQSGLKVFTAGNGELTVGLNYPLDQASNQSLAPNQMAGGPFKQQKIQEDHFTK